MRSLLSIVLHPRQLLTALAALLAAIAYVWIVGVRAVPGVRRRKAQAREAWRRRERTRGGARQ